jgi:hypothetical protein
MAKGVITMKKNAVKVSEEFKAEIKKMTKEQVYAALEEKVTAINEGVDDELKIQYNAQITELCKQYNELSKLTVYAECAKTEYPVLDFAKLFYQPSVKPATELVEEMGDDDRMHTRAVLRIEEGKTRLDLFDFLAWAEKCNKKVTADKNWKTPCRITRNSIANEWKKILESNADSNKVPKKILQENLQAMFDALLFIPSENGNNRVMATKKIAGLMFGFSNTTKDKVNDEGMPDIRFEVIPEKQWIKMTMYLLHLTVKDKDYAPNPEVGYCVEEEVVEAETK